MLNPFQFSDDNKRFHTYNYYLRQHFGEKLIKVSLNASMGCPNRDGSKGTGGCIYCSDKLSGEFAGNAADDIATQFESVRKTLQKKWNNAAYIAYFQAGTNSYAPLDQLVVLYESALKLPNVRGLSISTRADCIDEPLADYLAKISNRTFLTVELGLQTIHDKTSQLLNRCHSYEDFLNGYALLKERGINVCIHIINGLPYETKEMMHETASEVARLHPHSLKIHMLHVLKGTRLANLYEQEKLSLLERDEYVSIVCDQLELLPPDVVIARLTGDGAHDELIAPLWSKNKRAVLNAIDKELVRRQSLQGKNYIR